MSGTAARDQVRERSAARALLLAADAVTAVAVAMLALDGLRPGTGLLAQALVLMGAIIPRLAAELIESPRALFARGRELTPAKLLVAVLLLLALPAGYRALDLVPGLTSGVGVEMVLLLLCWIVGFGLRDPAAYVIYEPLALGCVLLSLVRGASHAVPLVAAAFLAVCVSGALRRQLADSSDPDRTGRVNVKSARMLGTLAALLLVLVFALSNAGLSEILSRTTGSASREGAPKTPAPRKRAAPDESKSRQPSRNDDRGEIDPLAGRVAFPGGTDGIAPPSLRRGTSVVLEGEDEGEGSVLLQVTPLADGPEEEDPASLPDSGTLWRARTYVTFDARKQEWTDDERDQWSVPAADDRTIRRAAPGGGAPTTWEAAIVAQRLDCVLLPYSTQEIRLETDGSVEDLRSNPRGDLTWARLGLRVSPTYWVTLQPLGAALASGVDAAPESSPLELAVPERSEIGADLHALARKVLGGDGVALPQKIVRLRSFLKGSFRYVGPADAARLPDGLGEFLETNRVGNCQHFATAAALLLRASRVSTRLVTGFAGVEWDRGSSSYVVRSGDAHAWIEVSTTAGWLPVDPTAWVRAAPPASKAARTSPPQNPAAPPRRPTPPSWLVLVILTAALAIALLAFRRRARPRSDAPEPEAPAASPPTRPPPLPFVPRTPAEILLVDYGRLQEDLAVTGQERWTHETPREHASRVAVPDRAKVDLAFSSLVPLIDDGLYGKVDLTEADLSRGRRNIGELRRELG